MHTPPEKNLRLTQTFHNHRENRRPMLPCYPRLLQIPHSLHARLANPAPLGEPGPSEDCATDQIRGGAAVAAGAGHQSRALRAGYTGCRTDSDCQWESHGTGSSGTQERGGWGYGAFEVVVGREECTYYIIANFFFCAPCLSAAQRLGCKTASQDKIDQMKRVESS